METKTIENGADAAINLAHLSHEVARAKTLLDDAIDDGKRKAQRVAKRGYAMAEDCVEDTTYYIKRHPWESVGFSLGVGTMLGMLCGWYCARMSARAS
jgi:ElaB/YqjD/DUF883 family membrane-anchored ribosome-binding protein